MTFCGFDVGKMLSHISQIVVVSIAPADYAKVVWCINHHHSTSATINMQSYLGIREKSRLCQLLSLTSHQPPHVLSENNVVTDVSDWVHRVPAG
jgi:hypothetical protein